MDEAGLNTGRVLLAVALAQFTVTRVMSIVNVALPAIRTGLDFDPDQLSWVINSYSLVFGGLLLLGGRAADVYGQRRLLVAGVILAVAELVAAVVPPGRAREAAADPGPADAAGRKAAHGGTGAPATEVRR